MPDASDEHVIPFCLDELEDVLTGAAGGSGHGWLVDSGRKGSYPWVRFRSNSTGRWAVVWASTSWTSLEVDGGFSHNCFGEDGTLEDFTEVVGRYCVAADRYLRDTPVLIRSRLGFTHVEVAMPSGEVLKLRKSLVGTMGDIVKRRER